MNLDTLFTTIQSRPHGSSGRGTSYWNKAAACGRRAILEEQHNDRMQELRQEEALENEGDDALSVGTYYHALMEMGLRGQLDSEIWDQTDEAADGNFLEAIRLYRAYVDHWGSPLARWGASLVGVEVNLGSGEQTGRADAIFRFDETDTAYVNTGLLLPGPGVYIVDWKTGKAKSERDQWDFGFGNQSINYLSLARRSRPDLAIKGMLFDKILRHKVIRKEPEFASTGKLRADKSYSAYLAQYQPGDEQVVENLIKIGKYNVDNNIANSSQCFSGAYPCPMFKMGLCNRR